MMRNVAIVASCSDEIVSKNRWIQTVELHGASLKCGVVRTNPPSFNPTSDAHKASVLVKVKAFSCNYRDQNPILLTSVRGPQNSFYVIGSDFVGAVLQTGNDVNGLKVGDKVIGNNAYKGHGLDRKGEREGIPTNHASAEYQVIPAAQLLKIPYEMPEEKAAAFSVNSQTAYSMVRKLEVTEGENVLVTSARSNTSLAAILALRKHRVNVYALTTSTGYESRFGVLGVKEVIRGSDLQRLGELAVSIGGFQCVIDPFYDLNLLKGVSLMASEGRYTSCGMWNQFQALTQNNGQRIKQDFSAALTRSIMNNLKLLFNCLGSTGDLQAAIQDYSSGDYDVVIDSIHTGDDVGAFLWRTFNAPDRFGKVVYRYS